MSTAIATVETSTYLALQDGGELREAMEANMLPGEQMRQGDLIHVKTPSGGGTKWIVPTIAGDEYVGEITGILACIAPRGVLWPTEDAAKGTLPILQTDDMLTAFRRGMDWGDIDPADLEPYRVAGDGRKDRDGNEIEAYDWVAMTSKDGIFDYGTGKKGHGKRVKEQRILFILREADPFPLVVTVQPGSLTVFRSFLRKLTMAQLPHYRAIVSLGLEVVQSAGGNDYARILPKLAGQLSVEDGEKIKAMYRDAYRKAAKDVEATNG